MISRYEAYMDGKALSSIDPSICVLDIQPGDVSQSIRTVKVAGRAGARVIKKERNSTSVTVIFEIHEYNTVKRDVVCQKIQKWADGDILCVSTRPEQQMRCVCEEYPRANAKAWTEPLSMTFTAYNPPYWQEKNKTIVTLTGTSASSSVYVPGNVDGAVVELSVKANAAAGGFSVQVGSTSLTVLVSMAADDVVTITYDDKMIQSIKKGNTSILDKRTGADDLLAKCGQINVFALSSDASVTATFSVRGCWN